MISSRAHREPLFINLRALCLVISPASTIALMSSKQTRISQSSKTRLAVLRLLSPAEDLMTNVPHLVHFLSPNAPQALSLAPSLLFKYAVMLCCALQRAVVCRWQVVPLVPCGI